MEHSNKIKKKKKMSTKDEVNKTLEIIESYKADIYKRLKKHKKLFWPFSYLTSRRESYILGELKGCDVTHHWLKILQKKLEKNKKEQ